MADKIDMSLDEIIKRDKISTGRGRRGGGKFSTRKSLGSGGKNNNRAGAGGRNSNIRKVGSGARQMKAGGARKPRRFQSNQPRKLRNLPDKWAHDKFVDEVKSATLMISNLHYGVSDQDIRELFAEFGPLKKAAVHYDSSGRSLGQAEVIFFKIADSVKAMNKYNGVPLDGRPMNIKPVVSSLKSNITARIGKPNALKNTKVASNARGGRNARRGGRAGGKPGQRGLQGQRGGGNKQKVPTAAELDADLDAYTNKT